MTKEDSLALDDEDPLSFSGPYVALLGMTIALATIIVPIFAVISERPLKQKSLVPTALEIDGSNIFAPIPFSGFS